MGAFAHLLLRLFDRLGLDWNFLCITRASKVSYDQYLRCFSTLILFFITPSSHLTVQKARDAQVRASICGGDFFHAVKRSRFAKPVEYSGCRSMSPYYFSWRKIPSAAGLISQTTPTQMSRLQVSSIFGFWSMPTEDLLFLPSDSN